MHSDDIGVVDFPTLGDLVDGWIERHCVIPAGFKRGHPFRQYDWQFWCTANHYRVREDATFDPADPPMNQAFEYRLSQLIGPQKAGKGPWAACLVCNMAVGPTLFGGWAGRGDVYRCDQNGCGCGWYFEYEPGEPMGARHPSPLIQLTANSAEQVKTNIWDPLSSMIRRQGSPLAGLLLPRGDFIRISAEGADPEMDRVDMVTSSAKSRLGNPISDYVQDESGLYTKHNGMSDVGDTQERGAAGMGGRGVQMTNPWDPAMESFAQTTFEANLPDVFTFYRNPDLNPALLDADGKPLSYLLKVNRRKIHSYVYEGSDHVNLDSIEALASALIQKGDPAQAERFFGNRVRAGGGAWLPDGVWDARRADVVAAAA